jgi:hypothetical protein
MVKEWPARAKALQRKVAHRAAEMTLESIKEKVPKTDAWQAYRTALEIAQVNVNPQDGDAFMVRANPKARTVRNVDASDTLLYVRGHNRLKKISQKVRILEKYSPWTLQTLPFTPDRSEARIVSRKVSKREADKIASRRLKERHKWRSELSREGVRPLPIRSKEAKVVKTVPDVAFEAMRMEFGIGQKAVPHWRPAAANVLRNGIGEMKRDPQMQAALGDPRFTGWKRWGKIKAKKSVGVGEAKKLLSFQKRLGIRVGR